MAVSSNEWTIHIYDLNTLTDVVLRGHKHNIPGIEFTCDGNFLVSCSIDGSLRIWNVETKDLIASDIISDEWHWTAQFISIEDVQTVQNLSSFLRMGVKNSSQISQDESIDDSTESWHSASESEEDVNYYDCIEDPKFLSRHLILSSSVTSIFLSEQCGNNIIAKAQIKNLSDINSQRYRDLDRLSIVKWIREISAAIVVSQAGLVGVLRIVK